MSGSAEDPSLCGEGPALTTGDDSVRLMPTSRKSGRRKLLRHGVFTVPEGRTRSRVGHYGSDRAGVPSAGW